MHPAPRSSPSRAAAASRRRRRAQGASLRRATVAGDRLKDGCRVITRPTRPADFGALKSFFESLSPATRRLRFHMAINQLPEALLQRFAAADQHEHVAFVAEAVAASDSPEAAMRREVVAEARYVRGPDPDSAEIAVVVADGWRRLGLGASLMRSLMRQARRDGLRHLCGEVLPENQAMRGLLQHLGATQQSRAPGREALQIRLEL